LLLPLQFVELLFTEVMGQEQLTAHLASNYIRMVSPGIIVYFWASSYNALGTAMG
jgi:Na+-driven multidrug efflux pump